MLQTAKAEEKEERNCRWTLKMDFKVVLLLLLFSEAMKLFSATELLNKGELPTGLKSVALASVLLCIFLFFLISVSENHEKHDAEGFFNILRNRELPFNSTYFSFNKCSQISQIILIK